MSKIVKVNLSLLEKQEADARAVLANVAAQREQVKLNTEVEVKETVTAILPKLAKILGREFNLGELAGVVSAMSKDKPLFPSVNRTVGNTAKLTDEVREQVKAAMLARAAALKLGNVAEPISQIAKRLGTTDQTAANYKPTKAQVDALPGDKEVPASAYVAA